MTEARERTRAFTLQYVAGRDNIKPAMRYVHRRDAGFDKSVCGCGICGDQCIERKRSVQDQLEMPSRDEVAKVLIIGNLQSAEVVELADTPS